MRTRSEFYLVVISTWPLRFVANLRLDLVGYFNDGASMQCKLNLGLRHALDIEFYIITFIRRVLLYHHMYNRLIE